mgnify:CR=1 FL=1
MNRTALYFALWTMTCMVSAIVGQAGFDPLAVAFKRVVNIIQKQAKSVPDGSADDTLFVEDAERALYRSFLGVRSRVNAHIAADDYPGALKEITSLKPSVDTFFDKVMVMDQDIRMRDNRVRMLREIGAMFGRVADFSQIQA